MEKGKLMMIIIIALLVLLLGTVIGVTLYVTSLVNSRLIETNGSNAGTDSQIVKKLERSEITPLSLGEPFQLNLQKGTDGKDHFIGISVSVGYDNTQKDDSTALGELLANDVFKVRSIVSACIYSKTYDDLRYNSNGLSDLSAEILGRLQEEYNTSLIYEVILGDPFFQ
ncbi:MAG: flagellar basal body-associated FliL family protein [Clostridiales bacterium]|jgi:flagellar basal body-associated protein FliL|nr:flagellar basal body-associated FliL family protein [Clostridiales bacterium]